MRYFEATLGTTVVLDAGFLSVVEDLLEGVLAAGFTSILIGPLSLFTGEAGRGGETTI